VNELTRLDYEDTNALSKASETNSQRHDRRLETEEKASSLRDDKMLSVGISPQDQTHGASETDKEKQRHYREDRPSHPLTLGNLEKHSSQQRIEGEGMLGPQTVNRKGRGDKREASSSVTIHGKSRGELDGSVDDDRSPTSTLRPDFKGTRKNESESTLRNIAITSESVD